jgi:hypothetical protein
VVAVDKLTLRDLKPIDEYERTRVAFGEIVSMMRKDRLLTIGPRVRLVFENRQTVLYQIQERLRAANIRDRRRVADELGAFNGLLPHEGMLSASLIVDTGSPRLQGLERSVVLELGLDVTIRALCERSMSRRSAGAWVHRLLIPLDGPRVELLRDPAVTAAVRTRHRSYRYHAAIPPACRFSLVGDLGVRVRQRIEDRLAADAAARGGGADVRRRSRAASR